MASIGVLRRVQKVCMCVCVCVLRRARGLNNFFSPQFFELFLAFSALLVSADILKAQSPLIILFDERIYFYVLRLRWTQTFSLIFFLLRYFKLCYRSLNFLVMRISDSIASVVFVSKLALFVLIDPVFSFFFEFFSTLQLSCFVSQVVRSSA